MKKRIVIVDDEKINISVLSRLIISDYQVHFFKSGQELLNGLQTIEKPDLILLDVIMPGLTGYQVLAKLKTIEEYKDIPVMLITALDSSVDEERGFLLGADDYIIKPFSPAVVKQRIRVQLEIKEKQDKLKVRNEQLETEVNTRVSEIVMIQDLTLGVITELVETRDNETGNHISRTSRYLNVLANKLQGYDDYKNELSDSKILLYTKAAPLHDIGKIGIPDTILLKPGRLTPEETKIMQTHTTIGGNVIERSIKKTLGNFAEDGKKHQTALEFLEASKSIILYHHEKWDGTGYPYGKKGTEIPIPARIMAIADVFDALSTPRVYKEEWKFDQAFDYVVSQGGTHFDPIIIEVFKKSKKDILKIYEELSDWS